MYEFIVINKKKIWPLRKVYGNLYLFFNRAPSAEWSQSNDIVWVNEKSRDFNDEKSMNGNLTQFLRQFKVNNVFYTLRWVWIFFWKKKKMIPNTMHTLNQIPKCKSVVFIVTWKMIVLLWLLLLHDDSVMISQKTETHFI